MITRHHRTTALSIWLLISARRWLVAALLGFNAPTVAHADESVGYDQVKEILRKRCVTCHNPEELRGDLDLKELTAIKAGSASGAVVVPGDPAASLLYTTTAHLDDPTMPPNGARIPEREIDLIRRWIADGLPEKSGQSVGSKAPNPMSGNTDEPGRATNSAVQGLSAIRELPQPAAITSMDAHPTGDLIAVSGLRQAVLIRPSTGELVGAVDVPKGQVTAIRFSVDGQLLLIACGQSALSSSVMAFDLETNLVRWQIGDETDSILTLDLSPDGQTLAVGGPSKVIKLYAVPSGELRHTLKKHTDWVMQLRYSPDGLMLASSDRFGGVVIWQAQSGSVFQTLNDHAGSVTSLAWNDTSDCLLSGGEDGIVRSWDLHLGELTEKWDARVGGILALVRGDDFTAATGRGRQVSFWNSAHDLQGLATLSDQGQTLAVSKEPRALWVGDAAGRVAAIDLNKYAAIRSISLPVNQSLNQQLLARLDDLQSAYVAKQHIDVRKVRQSKDIVATKDTGSVQSPISLAANQRLVESLNEALQASNESLASLTKLNAQLMHMLEDTTQLQAALAAKIAMQAKTLNDLRVQVQQIESGSADNSNLSGTEVSRR